VISQSHHVWCLAGKYRVEVKCHGVDISGSPFIVSVWDASQIEVFNVPTSGHVGKPATFNSASLYVSLSINQWLIRCFLGWTCLVRSISQLRGSRTV